MYENRKDALLENLGSDTSLRPIRKMIAYAEKIHSLSDKLREVEELLLKQVELNDREDPLFLLVSDFCEHYRKLAGEIAKKIDDAVSELAIDKVEDKLFELTTRVRAEMQRLCEDDATIQRVYMNYHRHRS